MSCSSSSSGVPVLLLRRWVIVCFAMAGCLTVLQPSAAQETAAQEATAETGTAAAVAAAVAAAEEEAAAAEEKVHQETREEGLSSSDQEPRGAAPEKIRLAQLVLSSDLPESPGATGPFGNSPSDLRSTIARLEKAADDDDIHGLVLTINQVELGRGKVHELRAAIQRFRARGKKVYAQLEMAMPADYLLATACDEIVMPESGMLLIPGVGAEALFFHDLLEKVGMEADFLHQGEAKGAAEALTRRHYSEPVRRNLTSLIDDLYDQLVETICFERPITKEQAIDAIDEGLLTAPRAKELGLIDRVAYPNELRSHLTSSYQATELVYVKNYGQQKVDTDFSGPTGFFKLLKMMTGGNQKSASQGKKIAVVYAVGAITTGQSEQGLFGGSSNLGSETLIKALREANDDDDVAAIVLRINSPGGSALASDLIWNQIESIDKPVVASMGDVAASGGYYIAMNADKIFAEPATITGSIGVVGGKMALAGLYDKLGVTVETISRGKNQGIFSGAHPFSTTERQVVRAMMEKTYEQFTTKAATGRNMPVEQLLKLAGGKVYTGRQAKANGLVDELGTLQDAIEEAQQLAGIDAETKVKIRTLPEPKNFFDSLFEGNAGEEEMEIRLDVGSLAPELAPLARQAELLRRVFREPVALMLPFDLKIK